MKRWLIIVVVFLLAGAVVNVAVAWGWAVLIRLSGPGSASPIVQAHLTELEPDGSWRFWSIMRSKDRGVWCDYSYWDTRSKLPDGEIAYSTKLRPDELAPSWASLRTPPDTDYAIRWVHAYGWPVVSMWRDYGGGVDGYMYELLHGLPVAFLPPDGGFPRAVPLSPIWPGFIINTLFYAAVLWLLIPGPFVLRRFIRMKRGRCVKCGYPMGGSGVCSECGAALPSPKVVTP